MSYTFLLEQGEESSVDCFSDIPRSVLSKFSQDADEPCYSGNETGCSLDSLCGMMFAPLTDTRGGEQLMPFAVVSPAKASANVERGQDLTTNGLASGQKWSGSFAKYDLDMSLWKTHQCCLDGGLAEFSEIWPDWGSMHDGECFPLAPLVLHIHGRDCFYWHTPTANDHKPAGQSEMAQVQKWLAGGTVKNTYIRLRSLLAARCGRREPPNPPFLEWLMGWPIGWTETGPLAMDRFQSWLHSHGKR